MVLVSINRVLALAKCIAPMSPMSTSVTSGTSPRQENTTSASRTASSKESANVPPTLVNVAIVGRSLVRFQPSTEYPRLTKLAAIAPPITPKPRNAIF